MDPFGFCGLKDGLTDSERFWRDVVGAAGDAAGWVQTGIHTALDVAGVFDPSGVTDLWNSAAYAGEALSGQGGWRDSAISAAAIVPYIGDLGKAGKYGAKAVKIADKANDTRRILNRVENVTDAARGADKFLDDSVKFLGKGYDEIASGVFRSSDGLRQVRFRDPDLLGAHGRIGGHGHFEFFDAATGAKIKNVHIPIKR